ncbi:hypothetical protein E2C01_045125 [Portunus trituberculatus]|uniref:Uncharacterized protein n=1 Tax=Portunus trituberculatus TaxID=210409 RepID=A0A5B7FU33_PORTR|nr:hypothetical protein [Portunus trituberculatus]
MLHMKEHKHIHIKTKPLSAVVGAIPRLFRSGHEAQNSLSNPRIKLDRVAVRAFNGCYERYFLHKRQPKISSAI